MDLETRKRWLDKVDTLSSLHTPALVTDFEEVGRRLTALNRLLPEVGIYYAIKSNDDTQLLRFLKGRIEGFDIASLGEFKVLEKLDISSERIVYSNPVKVPSHIEETFRNGVRHFAIDSVGEVEKIKANAPGSTVYLRIKVSDYGSKFPLSVKFGLDPNDAVLLAQKAAKAGLKVKGITFHVGSQSEAGRMWDVALKVAGKTIKALRKKGLPIEFLDIGGGLPAQYEDQPVGLEHIAKTIRHGLTTYVPHDIRVFAEPGRYISANASVLVTTVIGRELRNGSEWLYLDMGVFQGLIEALENGFRYPIFARKSPRSGKKSFTLTGPSCDPYDTIGFDYKLPSSVKTGDQLIIGSAGAYTMVYASSFNGFAPPQRHYVQGEK